MWWHEIQFALRGNRNHQLSPGNADFPKAAVTEIMKDLHDAIAAGSRAAGIPRPVIGAYGQCPSKQDQSQQVFDFASFYPAYVDIAQPSLYYGDQIGKIREVLRNDYKLLKARRSIPWLTAGTYGEFDPHYLEYIVLEAFMNGVSGIAYYCFTDFDTPLDYYYHARALALLAPYEDLLFEGQPLELETSSTGMFVSAVRRGGEMLILLNNYMQAGEKVEITLPFAAVDRITDVRGGKPLPPARRITLEVPKGDIRFLHIRGS